MTGEGNSAPAFGWLSIVRLGLVQTALGAVIVFTTSTINRVMVVEMMLPAIVPGALVGFHYAIQLMRPRFGYSSDVSGRRTPLIIGGMAVLAAGGFCAALATAWSATNVTGGIALAIAAFTLIGLGVGAAGVSLLALLSARVTPGRRSVAATIVWLMMIAGFVATTAVAGQFLDPFSTRRLVTVAGAISLCAFLATVLAVIGVEGPESARGGGAESQAAGRSFRAALSEIWRESHTRRFTIFIFVSMLAYSGQDLILEPFAGMVFGMTPGQSTTLASVQNAGVLVGMIAVAIIGSAAVKERFGSMRLWTVIGCCASAVALGALVASAHAGGGWPLRETVFALGLANGVFAVAAIASMMELAGAGGPRRHGMRMGLWGAGQAVAFGLGGVLGTVIVDLGRLALRDAASAYALVFATEAALFLCAALLATRIGAADARAPQIRAAPSQLAPSRR
jgi:BCD family chlorophyll transporter-like MFS transporter